MATSVLTQTADEVRDLRTKITVEARSDARAWIDATPEERGPHAGDFLADAVACFEAARDGAAADPSWSAAPLLPLPVARTAFVTAYLAEIASGA